MARVCMDMGGYGGERDRIGADPDLRFCILREAGADPAGRVRKALTDGSF